MIAVANQDLVELARKQVRAEEASTIRPYAPFRPYGVHLERHQQLLRNQELKPGQWILSEVSQPHRQHQPGPWRQRSGRPDQPGRWAKCGVNSSFKSL